MRCFLQRDRYNGKNQKVIIINKLSAFKDNVYLLHSSCFFHLFETITTPPPLISQILIPIGPEFYALDTVLCIMTTEWDPDRRYSYGPPTNEIVGERSWNSINWKGRTRLQPKLGQGIQASFYLFLLPFCRHEFAKARHPQAP